LFCLTTVVHQEILVKELQKINRNYGTSSTEALIAVRGIPPLFWGEINDSRHYYYYYYHTVFEE
jgi:hypothetical protein